MQKLQKTVFQKLGGAYQYMIKDAKELIYIQNLDQAHWITTSADIHSFNCDKIFLAYLDDDKNARITSENLKKAIIWLATVLNDISTVNNKSPELKLNDINTQTTEGKNLKNAAERILKNINADNQNIIKLNQVQSRHKILAAADRNGDGIIPPSSVKNINLQEFADDIFMTMGSKKDVSGKQGISIEVMNDFIKDAKTYINWFYQGKKNQEKTGLKIMVRDRETPNIFATIQSLKEKLDEFFLYCQLLKTDENISTRFKFGEKNLANLNINSKLELQNLLKSAPIAPPNTNFKLYFDDNINPFFSNKLKNFKDSVMKKSDSISLQQWNDLKKEFSLFEEWTKEKPLSKVESLGIEKLEQYLDDDLYYEMKKLFDADYAVANEVKQICLVEKILLFKKFILDFTNDFVSLSNLFDPTKISMLQFGRLIIDGRHFDLSIKINKIQTHKTIAKRSNICIMYLSLTKNKLNDNKSVLIATAITSGTVKNIFIGKRGLFLSNDGSEWDATVIDFIKHPVSISEALLMPFEKFSLFIKKQTDKFSGSTYSKVEKGLGDGFSNLKKLPDSNKTTKNPPPPTRTVWSTPLVLLGGGIGLAGLGSAFESLTKAWQYVSILQIFLLIISIILILILPIILAAIVKLRSRNIGIFLEASGRAVNAPLRLTYKMGLIFTKKPQLPPNSYRIIFDKISDFFYAGKKKQSHWILKLFLILSILTAAAASGSFLFQYFISI